MAKLLSPSSDKPKNFWKNNFLPLLRAIGIDPDPRYKSTWENGTLVDRKVIADPTPTPTPKQLPVQNMSPELFSTLNAITGGNSTQSAVLGETNQKEYRHPNWEKKLGSKDYQELSSGTKLASEKYPTVPQDLLMDIAMIEAGGRVNANQYGGPAQGAFQFEPSTLAGLRSSINPYSATESAELAAKLISEGQLSRWGTPGGSWGSLDASRREPDFRLSTYYSPEELNQFLAERYKFAL